MLKLTSIDAPGDIKDARFSGFGSPRRRNIKNPGPGASECPFGTHKCSRKQDPGQGDYLGALLSRGWPSVRVCFSVVHLPRPTVPHPFALSRRKSGYLEPKNPGGSRLILLRAQNDFA